LGERSAGLASLFKSRIDTRLLLERWDDLLRVAGSLKRGYVTASLLIGKLQAYPRQNSLGRVLQECGRLVKTIFVLRYLESETCRRRIHAQLNKGEALHELRRFLFFGGDGKIRRKRHEEQTCQAGCLNLMTNAVVVWNTVHIQAAVKALEREGRSLSDDHLVHLSPARSKHVNRYGKYRFDVEAAAERTGLRPLQGSALPT
jgi:TnpA family transposase